jgi:hypothetical protein
VGHVSRLLETKLVVDVNETTVLGYQESRLQENAAPKTINEEVRFLLKMLGAPGELIRARLRKKRQLKLAVGNCAIQPSAPQDLTFRQATRCLSEIGFGIPKMAVLDYVERRRILARSRAFAGYMTDIEELMVWK